jgi:hypothetical protein
LRAQPARPAPTLPDPTELRYTGPVPMMLRAPGSGTVYRFAEADALARVDPADAAALLRTGWFRRT